MAWGCREARNAHAPRVPLRPWKPPRRERGATHCVCVCHTARHRLWSVCVQLVGAGEGASPARNTAQTGGGPPHAQHRMGERVRAMADAGGGARALEPKAMRVVAQVCGWRGEGITVREGHSTGVAGRRVGGVFLGWSPRPVGGVGADRFVAHLGARGHAFTGGVGAASGAKSRGSLLVSEVRGLPQTLLWLVLVGLAGARMQRLFQN